MKYYISDLHLGHENVLLHDNRPFQNTEEMHHQMIARWNKVVSQTDEVYILGDFAWKNAIGDEVLSQLCGRKFRDSRKNNSYSLLSADYFCDCISY